MDFIVDGEVLGTAFLISGVATLHEPVPTGGARTIVASYLGDVDYASSAGTKVRYDPTISVEIVPSSGAASELGWYDGPVQVVFTCTPQGSPLVGGCPAPVTLDSSGAGQVVEGIVKAQDGGRAVASSGPIDIDLDAPSVRVGGVKDGKTYPKKPNPVCLGTDATSGLVQCTIVVTKIAPKRFRVVATAVDAAGHTSTATKRYAIKKKKR